MRNLPFLSGPVSRSMLRWPWVEGGEEREGFPSRESGSASGLIFAARVEEGCRDSRRGTCRPAPATTGARLTQAISRRKWPHDGDPQRAHSGLRFCAGFEGKQGEERGRDRTYKKKQDYVTSCGASSTAVREQAVFPSDKSGKCWRRASRLVSCVSLFTGYRTNMAECFAWVVLVFGLAGLAGGESSC